MQINFKVDTNLIDYKFPSNKRFTVQFFDRHKDSCVINWYELDDNEDLEDIRKISSGISYDYIQMDARPSLNSFQETKRLYVQVISNDIKSDLREVFSYKYYVQRSNNNHFKLE